MLVPISSGQWVRSEVHPGQAASLSQGNTETNKTNKHLRTLTPTVRSDCTAYITRHKKSSSSSAIYSENTVVVSCSCWCSVVRPWTAPFLATPQTDASPNTQPNGWRPIQKQQRLSLFFHPWKHLKTFCS